MNNFITKTKEIKEGEFTRWCKICSVTIDVRQKYKKKKSKSCIMKLTKNQRKEFTLMKTIITENIEKHNDIYHMMV